MWPNPIWLNLLKKSLIKNFSFCAVKCTTIKYAIKYTIKYTNIRSWSGILLCGSRASTLGPLLFNTYINDLFYITKAVKELSWMSQGLMDFWILLNFLFGFLWYSSFVIISCVFSSGISGRWKSSCSDIPRTIIKFDYIN